MPQAPIGKSLAHGRVLDLISKLAGTDVEILFTGETGVGKECYARFAHQCSPRADKKFVAVNCGGVPNELFENELFGHVGGAFTGARQKSEGLVAEAENGTLFFDEVDSLPMHCQVKLLRFLQEREYRRLGEARLRTANVRFIAATNADLTAAVQDKRFREDLMYRLRVVPVEVPPLRQRRDDIPLLLGAFCERYSVAYKLPRLVFSDRAMRRLLAYDWPGNVRELENCVKYLTCLQLLRPIDPYDLPLRHDTKPEAPDAGLIRVVSTDGPFQKLKNQLVGEFECAYLVDALRRSHGNIAHAAAASGKPRRVLFELMRNHGLTARECVGSDVVDGEAAPLMQTGREDARGCAGHAAAASGKPRRLLFELACKHGMKSYELSDTKRRAMRSARASQISRNLIGRAVCRHQARRRLLKTSAMKKTYSASMVMLLAASALAVCDAMAQASASVPPMPLSTLTLSVVELVKALAWPIVALVIAGGFRRPISQFVGALGRRITKLSLFKVELELVPASAATITPLLDDIRTATNPAAIYDSSRMMLEQVQSGTPADYALVSIGQGEEWLTSRLYIAAVMMERMRGVKAFVFVERTSATDRRFIAVAPVRQLRWALSGRYPWLEAAWLRCQTSLYPTGQPANAPPLPTAAMWPPDPRTLAMPQPPIVSDTGGFEPWQARQLVSGLIESLQRNVLPPVPPPPTSDSEWVTLREMTQERATWVTRELLGSLLPQSAFDAWANGLRDAPRARRTRAVLRIAAPFVALLEGDRGFSRLVNRQALLEEIAASLGEEPEGTAQ